MDRVLLDYYNRELRHLREMSGEFAKAYPKIASRLSLDGFGCEDPYVERLLEGMAYLAARVYRKLDAEFPRFTQALLNTVFPNYLMSVPSMAVVQFEPDPAEGDLGKGICVPRGTALRSIIGKGDRTPCEFRTAHDLTLWPLRVADAAYHTKDLDVWDVPERARARAGLRVRLAVTGGLVGEDVEADELTFFLRGADDELVMKLYEQVMGRCVGVLVQSTDKPRDVQVLLPAENVASRGFGDDEAMLPTDARTFRGYRLLREYFACPDRFLFVSVKGLRRALAQCAGDAVDIIFLFGQQEYALENNVDASSIALGCVPAVNLFERQTDRVPVSNSGSEFHIVVDRTRPLDFEVLHVKGVTGYGAAVTAGQEFMPFYSARDFNEGTSSQAYYAYHRRQRSLTERERRFGPRSTYLGSEVYVSLVDADATPYRSDLRDLGVRALCSNRDLPMAMVTRTETSDFTVDINLPVQRIACVSGPTEPIPSLAESFSDWRIISHLSLNYLSLVEEGQGDGAAVLRDILRLYCDPRKAQLERQVDGLTSVAAEPVVRRMPGPGPITFVRGLQVALTFNEDAFRGTGIFLLGAVLEQFISNYVSVNSFTETVIRSTDRGEVMAWPTRCGTRFLI